jgi:hypothetical protein
MEDFVAAERTSDWKLHLSSVRVLLKVSGTFGCYVLAIQLVCIKHLANLPETSLISVNNTWSSAPPERTEIFKIAKNFFPGLRKETLF